MASSSSSSSLESHRLKYDVFLSFRGEDTRCNFTSHLYATLCQKDLLTFFDNEELKRGEAIDQSLPRAIQDSAVAVLVFSKDYASSTWCLDELAEIIECHRTYGQIVIPIFYQVDASHIRKQSYDVAAAFVKHEQNPNNVHKIPRWRDALITATNLCGFNSKEFRNDHVLVNKIVEDILGKLNQSMTCDDFEHLPGMESRIEEIKEVFTINPLEIRILGIWGMGGVGKTTTAEVIYHNMSHRFQGCCFVRNVRQNVEVGGIEKLQEELISKALGEKDSKKYTFNAGPGPFLIKRLGCKKMLIVLDDVNDPLQLESLIGDPFWFGSGSMILITSRDKQVFEGKTNYIYEVKPLNNDEALHLFNKIVFKHKNPRNNYVSLSNSMVNYAQGNPLALKVLGYALIRKKENEWRSTLNQLSKVLNKDIQHVLQISYNGLNRVEKDVFLDIACFFECDKVDVVKAVLKSCGLDADIIISVLVDKSLVTIFGEKLIMHDLLQELGKEIIRQESKHPKHRSRLWDPEDIYETFVESKEADAVESVTLDLSKIRDIDLNPKVFMKMPNLKFLNFYNNSKEKSNLHLTQGLEYFPNKLRYFRWDKYPLKSFPPNFQPENLVVLRLSDSKIKELRKGAKEYSMASQLTYGKCRMIVHGFCSLVKVFPYSYGIQMGKLTSLNLANNKSITDLPNSRSGFLEALEILDLRRCSNLNRFPEISSNIKELYLDETAIKRVSSSSVELLSKLKKLEMKFCRKLENLPNGRSGLLEALEVLDLEGCFNLNTFPEISSNIKELNLSWTAIKQVPSSSVELLSKLNKLEMMCCRMLESLPSNFFNKLTSLKELNLFACLRIKELPEILEPMNNLELLHLTGTAIEKLPSSIGNLKSLSCLAMNVHHAVPLSLGIIPSLRYLSLSNYNLRELPKDLSFLVSVDGLELSGNNFERILAAIKQLPLLEVLFISDCPRLQSLPEISSSVSLLDANDFRSLKHICALKQITLESQEHWRRFHLQDRLKLDEHECQAVANTLLRNHLTAFTRNQMQKPLESFKMIYPGNRIPEWVKYRSMGDSIQISLPPHWLNYLFVGFAFCVCFDYYDGSKQGLTYDCYFGDNYHFSSADSEPLFLLKGKEHMIVFMSIRFYEWVRRQGNIEEDVAFFKFGRGIKRCGIIPLYVQKDKVEFDFPTAEVSKLNTSMLPPEIKIKSSRKLSEKENENGVASFDEETTSFGVRPQLSNKRCKFE